MNKDNGLWMRICFRAAAISILLGILTRIWSYYEKVNPARLDALFGIRADAFLRFTDTCLLLAIGLGIYQLVCQKGNNDK